MVLSRQVALGLSGPLPLAAVLRRLRAGEPNCTIFSMPIPDGVFFGASPELLVARHGNRVTCQPLAGTISRGDTARADADTQRDLARSGKSRAEHRYVVDAVAATLAPYCDQLAVPEAPSLVAFRSVAHLGTRIEGQLRDGVGSASSSSSSVCTPRPPWAAPHGPRPSPSSATPRRVSEGTGPGQSAGRARRVTANG